MYYEMADREGNDTELERGCEYLKLAALTSKEVSKKKKGKTLLDYYGMAYNRRRKQLVEEFATGTFFVVTPNHKIISYLVVLLLVL